MIAARKHEIVETVLARILAVEPRTSSEPTSGKNKVTRTAR